MSHSTTMTSKGQITIPVSIRKELGLRPGEPVAVELQGNTAVITAKNWQKNLDQLHKRVAAHLKKHNIKPLSDQKLDQAINQAGEQAARQRYQRSLKRKP